MSLKSTHTAVALLIALGVFAAANPAAPAPIPAPAGQAFDTLGPIAADSNVRQGMLPNGMHYAVMHNATPKGAVSIRFALWVGSFEEDDDQRGVAHFIEHMAFNGSKNFPAGSLDKVFADQGVGFGRDQNADTSLSVTAYRLDLNQSNGAKLDLAFRWLRDVGDGLNLDEDAVERERGVILSEREARLSPAQAQRVAVDEFREKGLRTPTRSPIGTVDSVSTMTSKRLRAFYDKWYRPENALIVVVGDAPTAELEKRVRETFGSWKGKGDKPARPARGVLDLKRNLDVLTRSDPQLATGEAVCRLRDTDGVSIRTVRRVRRLALRTASEHIINQRLSRLAASDKPPFLRAGVTFEGGRESAQACLLMAPLDDAWEPAMEAAATEFRRFALYGASKDELDQALADQRSALASAEAASDTRFNTALATSILDDILSGDIVASPDEKLRDFDKAAKTITPELLHDEFAADWAGNGPLINIVAPKAPDADTVRAAWTRVTSLPKPGAYEAPKTETWSYTSFGAPGRVVKREEIKEPGFVRLTFANGVVLNFKQTDFQKSAVQMRVRFGAGRREVPNDQLIGAQFGAGLFVEGGLGRFDADTLRRTFSAESWQPALDVGPDAFELRAATTPSSLEHEFQILGAYLTDPGFRPNIDARVPTAVDAAYRRFRASPGQVFDDAFKRAVSPHDPELLPPEAETQKLRTADFARLLKPAVTGATLEVTIVGDIDEATVTRLASATFGALPPRAAAPRDLADTQFLRFPETLPPAVRATHQGPAEKALAGVVWPLYVATPERRREEYAINLVSRLLADDLRHTVRQSLGKTYSPQVNAEMVDGADQGYLLAELETAPADVDQVAAAIKASARRLAKGEITAKELEAARAPLVTALAARRQTNLWWLDTLDGSAAHPGQIAGALAMHDLYRSITLEEVKAAAARWLGGEPLVATVVPSPR